MTEGHYEIHILSGKLFPWINLMNHFSSRSSTRKKWYGSQIECSCRATWPWSPTGENQIRNQVGAFLYIPHPKAPPASGSYCEPAPCLGAFLPSSYLVLILLWDIWHSPPFIRRWGNYGLERSGKLPRVPQQLSMEIRSVWVQGLCTSTTPNCCRQPESWKPTPGVYFFLTCAATGRCDLRSSYS